MLLESVSYHYPEIPVPTLTMPAVGAAGPPLTTELLAAFVLATDGTGSSCSLTAHLNRYVGYKLFPIEHAEKTSADLSQRYVNLILEIRSAFDRTFSKLPAVFGVSRQTLYNWRSGETPKPQHEAKLIELAAAARVFSEAGLKPTPLMLDRTVADGKSFLTLIAEGSDGTDTAETLVRIVKRGLAARARLDKALGDKPTQTSDSSDFGVPVLNEDA